MKKEIIKKILQVPDYCDILPKEIVRFHRRLRLLKDNYHERSYRVIIERFVNKKSLGEVGNIFHVTRERIRQIEAKAIQVLKELMLKKRI